MRCNLCSFLIIKPQNARIAPCGALQLCYFASSLVQFLQFGERPYIYTVLFFKKKIRGAIALC